MAPRIRLRVERPCQQDWEGMTTTATGRHCAACQHGVVDLVGRTGAEALGLLLLHGGAQPCGRIATDEDGWARFVDPPPGRGRRDLLRAGALGLALQTAACAAPQHPAPPAAATPARAPAPAPPADTDRDGIADASDTCPADPGPAPDGCPRRAPVHVIAGKLELVDRVLFPPRSARVKPISAPLLDAVAATLRGNPDLGAVHVIGHQAADEPAGLDRRRAQAAIEDLVRRGVAPGRLQLKVAGATQPIERGHGPRSELNRRVEFHLASESAPCPAEAR